MQNPRRKSDQIRFRDGKHKKLRTCHPQSSRWKAMSAQGQKFTLKSLSTQAQRVETDEKKVGNTYKQKQHHPLFCTDPANEAAPFSYSFWQRRRENTEYVNKCTAKKQPSTGLPFAGLTRTAGRTQHSSLMKTLRQRNPLCKATAKTREQKQTHGGKSSAQEAKNP